MPGILVNLSATQFVFLAFVLLLAVQRIFELRLSQRNEAKLLSRGGKEHAPGHFRFMKLTHTLWFVSMVVEVVLFPHASFVPAVAVPACALFLFGQYLRYAAIRTLGERWSVKILTVPGEASVAAGIYRYIRHPNYLGVILEIFAVPLLHGAWITAILFSLLNAIVLWIRIRAEEQALREVNEYDANFATRPRFVPGVEKSL